MAETKILLLKKSIMKSLPEGVDEVNWQDYVSGNSDNSVDFYFDSGWSLQGQSSTVFNNEERTIYTLTK